MIHSCEEHIEVAIDVIVDDYETFPILSKLSEEEKLSTTCEFCQKAAVYLVANK